MEKADLYRRETCTVLEPSAAVYWAAQRIEGYPFREGGIQ